MVTPYEETARLLQMAWGVEKILVCKNPFEPEALKKLLRQKKIKGTVVFLSLSATKRSLVVMDI